MAYRGILGIITTFLYCNAIFAKSYVLESNSDSQSILVEETNTSVSLTQIGSCEKPTILHGTLRVNAAVNYTAGSVVEIVCNDGYRFPHIKLTGLQVVCRSDGIWTDVLGVEGVPSCQLIGGCPAPMVSNGYIALKTGGFMPGDTAVLHCLGHFLMVPRNIKPVLVCNKDGTWSSEGDSLPTCEDDSGLCCNCRVPFSPPSWLTKPLYVPFDEQVQTVAIPAAASFQCPWPAGIENGEYQFLGKSVDLSMKTSVSSGIRVLYSCSRGYRISPNMSAIIECTDGQWSNHAPVCEPRHSINLCGSAPEIPHTHYYVINGSLDHNGSFTSGEKIVYVCDPGFRPACTSCSFTSVCQFGEWHGQGLLCIPEIACQSAPPVVPHAEYTISPRESSNGVVNVWGSQIPDGTHAFYYCNSGYRMQDSNATTLICRNGSWIGHIPSCVNRTGCDPPMDIENGNWIIQSLYADFRFGVHIAYECEPGFKAIGTTDIACLASGYWSDYPPKCLTKDEYCSEPLPIRDGFFMCKPSQCDSFRVGTELHYVCNKNYRLSSDDQSYVQTCQPGGLWSPAPPFCLPEFANGNANSAHIPNLGTNTVTVVVSSSCAVLGLLVLVMLAVALQRRLKPHGSVRLCPPSLPGASSQLIPGGGGGASSSSDPYPGPMRGDGDEHDRLALIAFADDVRNGGGIGAPQLPTYDEAMRSVTPHVYHGFPHFFDGGMSRTSSGRSSRSGEYRPLPSIRLMREAAVQPATMAAAQQQQSSGDPRRNSIVTNASNNLSVTAAFGSMDTVNAAASDATSTSVTVDTYDSMASNPSLTASQRAAAGSIESASMRGSLAGEAVPLIDQSRDVAACDTLRSQSSRGTHSDTASRIVEVEEDNKIN